MHIFGAGLSGLIAATQFPKAMIVEANSRTALSHRAVLRFRSDALSRLTGIPFQRVTVRKSIWFDGQHCEPDMMLANFYSRKTNGEVLDRSIWNIDPVERFIAPENLHEQLVERAGEQRFLWETPVDAKLISDCEAWGVPMISTLPLPILLNIISGVYSPPANDEEFKHKAIVVDRYRIAGANVFQTVYFPDLSWDAYRASITGDMLIVERRGNMFSETLADVIEPFGIKTEDVTLIDASHQQRFGKINPVDDDWRRTVIYQLTQSLGIYSLGRFAVWKNILLDDVVDDIEVLRRMIKAGKYGSTLQHHR